jgi:hypothetical protein
MTRFLLALTFLFTTLAIADEVEVGDNNGKIKTYLLHPDREITVPVSSGLATVLFFPETIRSVVGYGLTEGDDAGTYQYGHEDNIVTVRNLYPGKECIMTCVMGDESYVFHLVPSNNPVYKVQLLLTAPEPKYKKVTPQELMKERIKYTSTRIIDILKRAQNREVYIETYPEWYANTEFRNVEMVSDWSEVTATVREVHRFQDNDAIVLIGEVENKTDKQMYFDPQSVQIRCGERQYPSTLVDSSGMLLPHGKAPISVVLQGDTAGNRTYLSVDNPFSLILPKTEEDIKKTDPNLYREPEVPVEPVEEPRAFGFPTPIYSGGNPNFVNRSR